MLKILQELNDLKKANTGLVSEVKWQMSANTELNQTIAKLKHENDVLKKLALKDNDLLKDIMDNSGTETNDPLIASDDSKSGSNTSDSKSKPLTTHSGLNYSPNGINCGLNDDSDSLTEIEDITDSGNHSDAATDDLLLEIYSNDSPKEENKSVLSDGNPKDNPEKETIFNWNSWQEFFANDSNNDSELNDNKSDQKVRNNDTYNTSNHSLGTNDNRISTLVLN